jgi:hypothetical protein
MGSATEPRLIERFSPSGGRWVGIVGITVIAVLLVLMAFESGFSLGAAAVAAGFVLFGLAMYVALVRPTVHAYTDHLLVRNLVSDTHVPWHLITDAEVRQTLLLYTRDKVVHAVAIGRSARQQMRINASHTGGGAGTGAMLGMGRVEKHAPQSGPTSDQANVQYVDFVAERVLTLAKEQQQASRHRTGIVRRWAIPEIAALALASVAFVALVVAAS